MINECLQLTIYFASIKKNADVCIWYRNKNGYINLVVKS